MSFRDTSYWRIFRFVFVIFSLYLLGDAFYRWDGFRYYASFSEFIPAVALASILWSMLAAFASFLIWLPYITVEWFFKRVKSRIRTEHLVMFVSVCILSGSMLLLGIRYLPVLFNKLQLVLILSVAGMAILLSWLLRNKAEQLIGIIQQRITPLLWLFGVFVILAVPTVAYHTWVKHENNTILKGNIKLSGAEKKQPNIILVIFDTLTARDMSVYGYDRPTTPFISEWAKSASLFTNVKAESHITTPTTASLMTGKRLWTHRTYHVAGSSIPVKSNIESLPLELKKDGYYNMAFVVNPFASVRKLGVSDAFDIAPVETGFSRQATLFGRVDDLLYRLFGNKIRLYNWIVQRDFALFRILNKLTRNFSKTTAPPEKAFNNFLAILDQDPPEPFFAWIHLYPPHDPYLPPEPYMGIFDASSDLRTYKSQEIEVKKALKYSKFRDKQFPTAVQQKVDKLRARYDEFIRYCDNQFENFITGLKTRDKLNNSVIILSADHGESFEHALIKHSLNNLYEQITHIPLIIREPAQVEGKTVNALVEQIDIPATILELADIPVPSWMEGRSLAPLLHGSWLPPQPAFSMALEGQSSRSRRITQGRFAVWEGDYKLMYHLQKNKSLLFNLKQDPEESANLMNKEPEVGRRLRKLFLDNLEKANERLLEIE